MKTGILILLCLLAVIGLKAQNFSGIATYQSNSQVQIKVDSTTMSPQEMQKFRQELMQQMAKTYTLEFNAKASVWQQLESVDSGPATASSNGNQFVFSSGSSKNKMYRNLEEGFYRNSQELMGKRFLVVDSLPKFDWEISGESKMIGDYTCQKAIYSKISEGRRFATGMEEMEVTQDTTKIEAWFTMDIPVAHGPIVYYGLPGLILELKVNGSHFICSEISMNYKDPEPIKAPDQGKKVNREEFKAISDKKMKEMMQRYKGNGDNTTLEIVVGG